MYFEKNKEKKHTILKKKTDVDDKIWGGIAFPIF